MTPKSFCYGERPCCDRSHFSFAIPSKKTLLVVLQIAYAFVNG
jgi:hypothetical protein